MTERLLPTLLPPSLSTPSPIVMPEFSTLPDTIDQTLLQRALSRWQACQEGLQSLFADAPPNVGADTYWNARAPRYTAVAA